MALNLRGRVLQEGEDGVRRAERDACVSGVLQPHSGNGAGIVTGPCYGFAGGREAVLLHKVRRDLSAQQADHAGERVQTEGAVGHARTGPTIV